MIKTRLRKLKIFIWLILFRAKLANSSRYVHHVWICKKSGDLISSVCEISERKMFWYKHKPKQICEDCQMERE